MNYFSNLGKGSQQGTSGISGPGGLNFSSSTPGATGGFSFSGLGTQQNQQQGQQQGQTSNPSIGAGTSNFSTGAGRGIAGFGSSGTAGFGGVTTAPTTSVQGSSSFFSGIKPSTSGWGGTSTAGQTNSGLFVGTQNAQSYVIPPTQQNPQTSQLMNLLPTNFLKYDKINSLPEDLKKIIGKIELEFQNNQIYLDYSDKVLEGLQNNYRVISTEAIKVIKYCKLINSKNNKIKYILDTLRNEIGKQTNYLDKERKNFHIIEQHASMKISIPSEYFFNMMKELEDNISSQVQQISDLESLMDLHYRKEYGSFHVNSDIVEELIKNLYDCLMVLVAEAAKINDYVESVKSNYVDMMKKLYNWKDYEIENRLRTYVQNELNKEK